MKILVVILVTAAVALAVPVPDSNSDSDSDSDFKDEVCLRKHKVSNTNIDDIFNPENFEKPEENFKCYVNCVLQGFGFLDNKGHLNRTSDLGYIDLHDPEQVESFIKCEYAYVTGDVCERAYQTAKCISIVEAAHNAMLMKKFTDKISKTKTLKN